MNKSLESDQITALCKQYLDYLRGGIPEQILSLFAEGAIIHSPLYGVLPAPSFYHQLKEDTQRSQLRLKDIMMRSDRTGACIYFEYKWDLADGQEILFDAVDLLEINAEGLISEMRIIYDTVDTRPLLGR